ncbi:GAF domain-containing protein [Halorubrum vacuolatum]|uniref:histidine kinase n=1 Tax=Halorubrum vacuolatum TaxID=63740 RepID=A0A238UNP1_HALVU|nr:GAF domain-containing protein [Halorubrum vacuolatum]SNR22919.1 Signal transduction histidine kinase [Halorubrum vacuolatum]
MDRSPCILYVSGSASNDGLSDHLRERLGGTTTGGDTEAATIHTVTTGSDAAERLQNDAFDAIVIEHDPPTMDGLAVQQSIRDEPGELPTVLVPKRGSEKLAVTAFRQGITDYVPRENGDRPFGDRLADRIGELVSNDRSTPFERLPVGAAIWDDQLTLRRTNSEGETLLGRDRRALRGESLSTFLLDTETGDNPEQQVEGGTQQVLPDRDAVSRADGDPLETVVPTRTADGRIRTYEWVHRGLLDAEGDLEAVISTFRDVTARTERERRVNELRDRLRKLSYTTTVTETVDVAVDAAADVMEASLSGIHLVDADGERLSLASGVEELTEVFETTPSYERDSAPGTRARFVWDVFESGSPARMDDVEHDERIREETPARSVLIHPLGEHGVFVISAREPNAFDDTDEALAGILSRTLTTAMNRVKREEQRRTRERRLSRLHEATRDLIESETEREVAAQTVTAAEEVLGFPITVVRLFDPDVGGLIPVAESDAVEDVLPKRGTFKPDDGSLNWRAYERGEVTIHDDIEETSALDTGTGLRSLLVLPLGSYGTMSIGELEPRAFEESDISLARILATTVETVLEAHERRAELLRQRDELEAQNDRLERFADVLSHDLRNPLNVARGRLQLAREGCTCGLADQFEAIDDAHDRMETLIERLLTVAREGETILDTDPIELREFVARCWRTVDAADAELEVQTDRTIHADRVRLGRLFENCFRNAIEHGVREDGTVRITVGDLPNDNGFYIEDDGPGIPADRREEAFEFGYTTTGGGTGFGLAIVGQIVAAHGWEVTLVEGTEGGARFEFRTDPGS